MAFITVMARCIPLIHNILCGVWLTFFFKAFVLALNLEAYMNIVATKQQDRNCKENDFHFVQINLL